MKILYDFQAFDMQRFGGVSNSFVKLIENLPDGCDYRIALCESDNIHLKNSSMNVDFLPCRCSEENFISKRSFRGRGFAYRTISSLLPRLTSSGRNRLIAEEILKIGEFDVFHPTFFNPYFLKYLNGKPYVLTVHDMISEIYPLKDKQGKYKPFLCEHAAHIIAVSENTKNDLIEFFNVPEKKVTVIYHGAPEQKVAIDSRPMVEGRYVLYVGQRDGYKCFMPMVKALVPVFMWHNDLKLVCTGKELTKEEKKELKKLKMYKRVVCCRPDDRELGHLYSHALCFIYPSMYEGFGIPILEAYSASCPVLLNHASCFPEIAQDAAVYFHLDEKSSDLGIVMEDFLQMTDKQREYLLNKQQRRMADFSWKQSAERLAEIYHDVAKR